jgi:hypothetical protein
MVNLVTRSLFVGRWWWCPRRHVSAQLELKERSAKQVENHTINHLKKSEFCHKKVRVSL